MFITAVCLFLNHFYASTTVRLISVLFSVENQQAQFEHKWDCLRIMLVTGSNSVHVILRTLIGLKLYS